MIETILVFGILLLVVLAIVLAIWQMFVYIGLSWSRRSNSKDYNGIQNAEAIFEKLDDDIKVRKGFWSFTYVYYIKRSKCLKLGLIDSKRKSLWTVATTGRQAYSAHIIERAEQGEKPPISLFWIKLQTWWFGILISVLFQFLILVSLLSWGGIAIATENVFNVGFFAFLGVLFAFPILTATATIKTTKVMLENVDNIFGDIYTEEEIGRIRKLWKIAYIKAIVDLITMILYMIAMILKAMVEAGRKEQIREIVERKEKLEGERSNINTGNQTINPSGNAGGSPLKNRAGKPSGEKLKGRAGGLKGKGGNLKGKAGGLKGKGKGLKLKGGGPKRRK